MSTLTIRKVDEDLKRRLQVRAAENGRSMEAEIRVILADAVARESGAEDVSIGDVFEEFRRMTGGVDLDIPERGMDDSDRRIPDFS